MVQLSYPAYDRQLYLLGDGSPSRRVSRRLGGVAEFGPGARYCQHHLNEGLPPLWNRSEATTLFCSTIHNCARVCSKLRRRRRIGLKRARPSADSCVCG